MDLATYLRKELAEAQLRNPSYSIRAFAKKAGIGFGTLSMVLAGKRKLSQKTTLAILERLAVAPEIRSSIASTSKAFRSQPVSSFTHTQLKADQYYILSEWHYLAILNLIRTKNFESTPEHIADRLGISVQLAQQSLSRLERTNLVRWEKNKLVRTEVALETSDDIQSSAVRRSHYQTLDRARVALDETPLELRDFTWLTFRFNPSRMPELKKKIRDTLTEISEEFSFDEDSTEVYRFGTHFYPLTQTKPTPRRKK